MLVLALGAWGCTPGAVRLADGGSDAGRPDAGETVDAGIDGGADAGATPDFSDGSVTEAMWDERIPQCQ